MQIFQNKLILAVLATASAKKSPWVRDFDGMLEAVGCIDGPVNCGADNWSLAEGELCGDGRGCLNDEISHWAICVDVAKWQCFRECEEGEVLNPLRYCQCIPESQQYDMFCAPEPEAGREVALPDADADELTIIIAPPEPLAGLDENCEGFNEETGEPFPRCAEPLVCEEFGSIFGIFGSNFYCQYATGLIPIDPPEPEPPIDPFEPEPPIDPFEPEPPIDPPELAGGWSETIFEVDADFYTEALLSEEVIDQLREQLGIDFPLIRLDSYRQQVVAGINYLAKYEIADPEGDGLMQFLAQIFDSFGQISVEAIETEGVSRDSEIPPGLAIGPILEIELGGLGDNCEGFNYESGEPFPNCQPDFVCEQLIGEPTIPGADFFCTYATGLLPPEEEQPLLGGWSQTISGFDRDFDPDTLMSEGILDQLRDETGIDFERIVLDSYRQQVVAGTNYVALYVAEDPESGDLVPFLAEISDPLNAEAAVEAIMTEGVTGDIDIPAGLPVGPIIEIDPLPELEIDPLPELEPLPLELDSPLIGGGLLGGFGEEQRPDADLRELFLSEEIQDQLREQTGFDFDLALPQSFRSQVVAGTNYIVKFYGLSEDMQLNFLAEIYEPLPGSGELPSVTAIDVASSTTRTSEVPTQFTPSDPLPQPEPSDPLPQPEPSDPLILIEEEPQLLGGFSDEQEAEGETRELFLSEAIQDQLRSQSGSDFDLAVPIAYRSQVVAGTNYVVKFQALDSDPEYMLASIFEPLSGEPQVTGVEFGEQVTEESPIPTSVTPAEPEIEILIIEPPEEFCAGCFQDDSELNSDLLQSEGILSQLADQGVDLSDIEAVASKSQVVAGTNYLVKYRGLDEAGEEQYFLAEIFEPLPGAGDPQITDLELDGVTADSDLPDGL